MLLQRERRMATGGREQPPLSREKEQPPLSREKRHDDDRADRHPGACVSRPQALPVLDWPSDLFAGNAPCPEEPDEAV